MKVNNFIAGLVLMPSAVVADMQVNAHSVEKTEASAARVANIEVLNGIYKQAALSGISEKADIARYSKEMRNQNEVVLASALTDFYGLDEKHSFVLANRGSQYSNYYSFAHYYLGVPVSNEIVTLVLDNDGNIRDLLGTIDTNLHRVIRPKSQGMKTLTQVNAHVNAQAGDKTSPEAVIAWLANNESSPFYRYQLTVNSAKTVLEKNTFGEPVYAHKLDVFFVDEEGKPNRVLLVIDGESKEIYRQSGLLKLDHTPESSHAMPTAAISAGATKRLKSYGSNFFSGRRDYIPSETGGIAKAPMLTDCKFYRSETDADSGKGKGTLTTIHMQGSTSYDNWQAYQLSDTDCNNESVFYEGSQLGLTYAYSPLADAHYHGELVIDMYEELGLGPILGTCNARPNRQSNCKQLYGNYYDSSYAGYEVPIYQGAHYGVNYVGAFWSGQAAYYGDGGFGILPNVSLDIVAHELTHGFAEMTTDDIYMRALDETISDIAGEAAKEFIYNKTFEQENPYFAGNSYQTTYKNQFGSEAVREANVAIRVLLNPSLAEMPETASAMGQHELSGPLTKVFTSLVDGTDANKFSSYAEAFSVLAEAKKSCVHDGLSGYEGLKQASSCIIDIAKNMKPASTIDVNLITEFNKVNVKVDCLESSLCGVLAAGIQQQVGADSYTFGLVSNDLGLSAQWLIRSEGVVEVGPFDGSELMITQAQMDTFADTYEVEVKLTHQGGEDTLTQEYNKPPASTYCQASGAQGAGVYITSVDVQGVVFESGDEGYRYDPGRVIENLSSPFDLKLTADFADGSSSKYYYWDIWLDKNADGQFDSGEQLYNSWGVIQKTNSFRITFDESEMTQQSRLRVMVSENLMNSDGPCGDIEGEVEDVAVAVSNG
ncbi:hypothetical protein SG34_008990 [Thalassomonas viridans]|uniref:Uncharacterized protein n=1 Tax=Thalassomonas viridans TaxID=137584 RepID=A0AAF0C909_9GAMM|nr:GEVED domain-containing protein [Thalassomonas viridans]WDE07002.1 hypothetical protein SG34_008990 [Thalassomonas viridans]